MAAQTLSSSSEGGRKTDFFGLLKPPGGLEVGDIEITSKGIKGLGRLLGKIKKYVTGLEHNR